MDAINFQLTKIQNFKRERLGQRAAKWSAGALFHSTTMKDSKKGKLNWPKPRHTAGRKRRGASNMANV